MVHVRALLHYVWKMALSIAFWGSAQFLLQVVMDVFISLVHLHIPAPVMVMQWRFALVCRFRIWSLFSFTRQGFMEQAF